MASVYCKSCKAKITQADSTCPSCGSPTSRLIPIVLCVAVAAASMMLFNAYRQHSESLTSVRPPNAAASPSDKIVPESSSVGLLDE